jgi:coenzyme Q-binding protein COQ10
VIASVDTYPYFLPFILSSRVTAHDSARYPTRASLEIGYAGFKENFTSRVHCDPKTLVVEATSGEKGGSSAGGDEGLFEFLRTKWALSPRGAKETDVELVIEVKFKSAIYTAMMQAASPGVAGLVVKAFEKRVEEVVRSEGEGGR